MVRYPNLKKQDLKVYKLVQKEDRRQSTTLDMIASENYPTMAVREALGSLFVAKYSEGRPHKRYYGGMENVDSLEELAEERARAAFGVDGNWAVNVQTLSGGPANYEIYRGLLKPGDKIMGLELSHGGHLSHGFSANLSGQDFKTVFYHLRKDNQQLDFDEIEKLAVKEKPNLIVCGYTAYPRMVDFKKFRAVADRVGAYLLADISHIAGLIAGGVHLSPFPHADVVMATTHKSLRGPRGAIILCREELRSKIFPKVFPGLQGGPHNHTIAAIAVALKEAASPRFRRYAEQIVKNAKALAQELLRYNFKLVSGGTDTHLILVDLTNRGIGGKEVQNLLEEAGIVVNKNTIPYETRSPMDPSGIRLGTPALTTRGMKEKEMRQIAKWLAEVIENPDSRFAVKKEVQKLCKRFPIP